MIFKTLFLSHAPDADPQKHNSIIETGKYKLISFIVKSQAEALQISRTVYQQEGVQAIMLCPGFSHADVAEIFTALEGKVSVSVARGDGPSNRIIQPVIQQAFYK